MNSKFSEILLWQINSENKICIYACRNAFMQLRTHPSDSVAKPLVSFE